MTTTLRPMARPRGKLTKQQRSDIVWAKKAMDQETERYRSAVVRALREGASYREVSEMTGLSTATLQKWKRGATQ